MDPTVTQTTTHTKRVTINGPEPITLDDLSKFTSQAYELGIPGDTPIMSGSSSFAALLGASVPLRLVEVSAAEETS